MFFRIIAFHAHKIVILVMIKIIAKNVIKDTF